MRPRRPSPGNVPEEGNFASGVASAPSVAADVGPAPPRRRPQVALDGGGVFYLGRSRSSRQLPGPPPASSSEKRRPRASGDKSDGTMVAPDGGGAFHLGGSRSRRTDPSDVLRRLPPKPRPSGNGGGGPQSRLPPALTAEELSQDRKQILPKMRLFKSKSARRMSVESSLCDDTTTCFDKSVFTDDMSLSLCTEEDHRSMLTAGTRGGRESVASSMLGSFLMRAPWWNRSSGYGGSRDNWTVTSESTGDSDSCNSFVPRPPAVASHRTAKAAADDRPPKKKKQPRTRPLLALDGGGVFYLGGSRRNLLREDLGRSIRAQSVVEVEGEHDDDDGSHPFPRPPSPPSRMGPMERRLLRGSGAERGTVERW